MPPKSQNFVTARTRQLRDTELQPEDERTISHIEEHGCSIVSVARTTYGLGWSYSIGVFDTCGQPEIITVGLLPDTAQSALNAAAKLLREGVDLTTGRHRDLVGEVECEFRPVDPKWISQLMGWAVWYYASADFPVLQLIYPDLQNRFPGETDFDEYFEQPSMQAGAPMTRVENDFWASTDSESSLFHWKFQDSPHANAFLSQTVYDGTEPVTYVSHDAEDGAWQFLGESMSDGGGPVVSCLHHPIDRDRSLEELADLPKGWCAERGKIGETWVRKIHSTDD
ncbi:MAG TPA: DUF4262 domain-containing protein [Candidatus Acidoferrum sp.]|nr:DUF4262 domain-containing protein [Candidatus Acidoferrum sp.]